jgi:hypothetical protein
MTCRKVSWGNAKIYFEGWIHAGSLTTKPAEIAIPGSCKFVRIEGDDHFTRFAGAIRNPYPDRELKSFYCTFRLSVFDHTGAELCTQAVCVSSCSPSIDGEGWLGFDVEIPYPPSAFATYRIFRARRSGITGIFR